MSLSIFVVIWQVEDDYEFIADGWKVITDFSQIFFSNYVSIFSTFWAILIFHYQLPIMSPSLILPSLGPPSFLCIILFLSSTLWFCLSSGTSRDPDWALLSNAIRLPYLLNRSIHWLLYLRVLSVYFLCDLRCLLANKITLTSFITEISENPKLCSSYSSGSEAKRRSK